MRTIGLGLLLLAVGGLGALARHGLSGWVHQRLNTARPWGTAVVNLLGAALLAAVIAGWRRGVVTDDVLIILGAGFCAGFTTFSTWMVELVRLGEAGQAGRRAAWGELFIQLAAGVAVAAGILWWA